ncbi:Hypothetical protein SCF082_LOCUS9973 [Durusdinium trenchii]|uniref:RNA-editing substrate-binding complex 6 protein domain-containing protein n=1 Tax=Durusdinium trenchii TaxID=1381693 RepID=A0ABP0J2V3_9DINO
MPRSLRGSRALARAAKVAAQAQGLHSPTRVAPPKRGACRCFAALGSSGARSSHVGMFLHAVRENKEKFSLAAKLQRSPSSARHLRFFRPAQLLKAVDLAIETSTSLAPFTPLLAQKRYARYLCEHPADLVKTIESILGAVKIQGDDRYSFFQQIARLLVEETPFFGDQELQIFCALAKAGRGSFRKLREDEAQELVIEIFERRSSSTWAPDQAAEFFVAATRVGDTRATSAVAERLKLLISQLLPEISPKLLAGLAHSLRASSRPDSAHGDFVLLHAICRRAAKAFKEHQLSPDAAVTLLLVCSRWEIHDEELLQNASQTLEEKAEELPVRDLCEVIYAVSSMHVKDVIGLEAICRQLMDRAADMAEPDLVRLLRGLLKLRHHDEALMGVLAPLVLASQTRMQSVSLCNLIQALSFFFSSEEFFVELLSTATSRELQPISVQHILSALCRLQGRVANEKLKPSLDSLFAQIAKIALARRSVEQSLSPSFSPVQAMSSLAALAKLQQRNLVAASVFTSVLCGMGSSTVWHWAKSPYFAKHLDTSIQVPRFSKKRGAPFDLAKCRTFLGALEASKCVEILHSLSTLELHSRLTVHLTAMLCSILAPQMHELRAKEVLVVARAFSVDRLPNFLWRDAAEGPEGWRERALDLCFQSLRRHEHFLDSSYESLLPFKLLCLQVNFGTFGTRRLQEFLNPMLYRFVDRLNSLSFEQCEANREERRGLTEELTEEADASSAGPPEAREGRPGPEEIHGEHCRIWLGQYLEELPVDLLIQPIV